MTRRRMPGTPPERRDVWPPRSAAGLRGCPDCGAPVEYVVLDVEQADKGRRVAVERRENPKGTIACRRVGNNMHGYTLTQYRPVREGFIVVRLHSEVCPEAEPPTVQLELV